MWSPRDDKKKSENQKFNMGKHKLQTPAMELV